MLLVGRSLVITRDHQRTHSPPQANTSAGNHRHTQPSSRTLVIAPMRRPHTQFTAAARNRQRTQSSIVLTYTRVHNMQATSSHKAVVIAGKRRHHTHTFASQPVVDIAHQRCFRTPPLSPHTMVIAHNRGHAVSSLLSDASDRNTHT